MDPERNEWDRLLAENPGHSQWYIQRFRDMAAAGEDIVGEARLIDAMAPREARILDAGCGPGRLGGYLHAMGHHVVGVDFDPALIAAAEHDHPGPTWLVGDLATLDLRGVGANTGTPEGANASTPVGADAVTRDERGAGPPPAFADRFDVIVCAGNVMTFLAPTTRVEVLRRLCTHLADAARLVVGFGAGRGYRFEDFLRDAAVAGLRPDVLLSTWDLRPFAPDADFLVAVLCAA